MRKSLPRAGSLPLLGLTLLMAACAQPRMGPPQVAALPPPAEIEVPPPAEGTWPFPPPPPPLTAEELAFRAVEAECLAQAIYFEARGEEEVGRRAVASVVMNRVAEPGFPNTVCEVVRQGGDKPPCQFSWWCDGKSDAPRDSRAWASAITLAYQVLDGTAADPTEGAVFFHHTSVRPRWRRAFEHTATIGTHIFYRKPVPAEGGGGE